MSNTLKALLALGLFTVLAACAERTPTEDPVTIAPPEQPEQRQAPDEPMVKLLAETKARDSLQQGAAFAAAERVAGIQVPPPRLTLPVDRENYLHYRSIDVSSVKELVKRWYPAIDADRPRGQGSHRALDDIRESIVELRDCREHFIKN